MIQGSSKLMAAAIDFRQMKVRGRLPGIVPHGFVIRCVGFIEPVLILKRKPKVVESFSIDGIGIATCESLDRAPEVFFRFCELTATQLDPAQSGVAPAVEWISTQALFPIRLGIACCMPVLLQV